MLIFYWSDYACPYCYIGAVCLKQTIKELQAEQKSLPSIHLVMKSFELDPNAPVQYTGSTTERFAQKYHLSYEAAAQRVSSISQMGQNAGLSLHYEETRYTNTFDAHRLMKLAQSLGGIELAARISERLYFAYFCESLELADHKTLTRIALEEGIPKRKFRHCCHQTVSQIMSGRMNWRRVNTAFMQFLFLSSIMKYLFPVLFRRIR